ncbi:MULTISPECIES: hypothetical protein [unclassified Streptomyces]
MAGAPAASRAPENTDLGSVGTEAAIEAASDTPAVVPRLLFRT